MKKTQRLRVQELLVAAAVLVSAAEQDSERDARLRQLAVEQALEERAVLREQLAAREVNLLDVGGLAD